MCGGENESQGILCEWAMVHHGPWAMVHCTISAVMVKVWGPTSPGGLDPSAAFQSNPFQNGEELAAVPLFLTKAVVLDIDLNLYRCISLGRYRNRSLYILNRLCVCVCVCVYLCICVHLCGYAKGESHSKGLEKESWERNTKMCSLIPQPCFWKWASGKQYIFLRENKAISWAKGFFWGDVELLCDLREILDFSGLSSAQCSQKAMLIFIDYVWLSQVKDSPLTSE